MNKLQTPSFTAITTILAIFSSLVFPAQAAPPGLINHQGRIAVSGTNFDGTGHFKFALLSGSTGKSFWSNDDSSVNGSEPVATLAVPVSKGHYQIALGEGNPIPATIFSQNADIRLRVWFSTVAGGPYELLTPELRFMSTGYALSASSVGSVMTAVGNRATVDGDLHLEGSLLDSTNSDGEPGEVLTSTGTKTTWAALADNDASNELQNLTLSGGALQLSNGGGNVTISAIAALIPDNAINANMLAANSVGASEIATDAVGSLEIKTDAIGGDELRANSVGSSEILASAVGQEEIGLNAVGADELRPNSVGSSEIASNAVGSSEIRAGAVGNSELADGMVSGSKITVGAVNSSHITNSSIGGIDIANDTISSTNIAASAVGNSELATNSVTSIKIAANAVGNSEIAGQAVSSAKLAPAAVQAGHLDSNSVASGHIVNGTILGVDIHPLGLQLAGNISVGSTSNTDDDFVGFDDIGSSSKLIWDNSEDRFRFTHGLGLNGPLNAGTAGETIDRNYNFFSTGSVSPDSGDMANSGDVYILNDLEVDGRIYADGGLTNGSDRNRKENIVPVDAAHILERVVALPISHWNYNDDPSKREHIGTMAQDFHAAFRLGKDDKHISTIDADGVALAAIQALKAENDALREQNAAILKRLEALERAAN